VQYVRPARTADLPAIERLYRESVIGVTSLLADRDQLFERVQRSLSCFEHEATAGAGHEYYAFVLEDEGQILATAAITSSAGLGEPYYSYRNEIFVHASRELKVHHRVHVLNRCHDLTGLAQLCGFYIDSACSAEGAQLLSRARLMFIAAQRLRFGKRIIAEMQGMRDEHGQSPFWNALGRVFFDLDFTHLEQVWGRYGKAVVADLMPCYPIYVPLLPDEAQGAISQVHPRSECACQILSSEGFELDNYIDIFDGGAILTAEIDRLQTLQHSRLHRVELVDTLPACAKPRLISNQDCAQYRACFAPVAISDKVLSMQPDTAALLRIGNGDWVRSIDPLIF